MEMTSAKAMLVDPGDLDAGDAVTTTIPRAAIEEALAMGEPADLFLEVVRPAAAGATEPATVSVAWEKPDLERLLLGTTSDAVTFSFRASELERALDDPEFEGHGLRETAAILAVAAAAAAATASQGVAKPIDVSGTPAGSGGGAVAAATVHDEAIAAARTGAIAATAASTHDEAGLTTRGIPTGGLHDEAVLADRGITPEVSAPASQIPTVHDEAIAAGRQMNPVAATTHDEASLAARGIETTPTHDEESLTARGIDIAPAATHDEATLVARGIEAETPADTGTGFDLPSVDPGVAAAVGGAAGGAALLIAAAAFAARGRRPIRPV
jgi:hypothetical protein